MILLGHWAASVVLADLTHTDRSAAIAGALFPDVIDKTGNWLLRVMPSARWLAHGLPFFAATTALTFPLLKGGPQWKGFALGYAGHLAGDLYAGGRVPWFAPFERPRQRSGRARIEVVPALIEEIVGAAVLYWRLKPASRS